MEYSTAFSKSSYSRTIDFMGSNFEIYGRGRDSNFFAYEEEVQSFYTFMSVGDVFEIHPSGVWTYATKDGRPIYDIYGNQRRENGQYIDPLS
jgi:hypothetical protein